MTWSTRRQAMILFGITVLVILPVGWIMFDVFYNPPTCFDQKQNGDEIGVDCGGSCQLLCTNDTLDPIVEWERFFEVSDGWYNAVVYIENQNPDAGLDRVPYTIRLYGKNNELLTDRSGRIRIPPKDITIIAENGLFTGTQDVQRIEFDFTEEFNWEKEEIVPKLLSVENKRIQNESTSPRVTADIFNQSIVPIKDVQAIVILYNNVGNAIGSSSTIIESINPDDSETAIFTWPQPFDDTVTEIEIVVRHEAFR